MRVCSALVVATALLCIPAAAQQRTVPASQAEIQLSYSPLVKQVTPAVVNVYASRVVAQRPRGFPFDDPLFQEFFGGQMNMPRERLQRSLGSGVLVGEEGIVVTNNHVIQGMTDVRISLVDQREFDVDVVLTDPVSDIAVLKVRDGKGKFPVVPLVNGDGVEVGDIVLAIGNPYGLGQSVSQGIVSAIRRIQKKGGEQAVYLQTDAAINQGNSGGALIDMKGNLLGINTLIYTKTGGSDGIGFAVPASIVKLVLAAARNGDKVVRRPWIGADLQAVTREIAESMGLDRPFGALVAEVDKDSPAARAGLKPGDIVTAVEDKPVEDPTALTYQVTIRPIGSKAVLHILRQGKETTLNLPVDSAPETVPRDERLIGGKGPFSGAKVVNVSPAVAQEIGLDGSLSGVLILDIENGSVADRVGLEKGDRVLMLNDQKIDSVNTLASASEASEKLWKVTIQRGGQVVTRMFRF
ncbi:Do family serine endopeptidase [Terrihabitans soli]|nr:Do family serine endopeptidase [Terrihabitans soli]